jgi:TolA-binding protein
MTSLKEEHDRLLAEKPEDAEHDTASCVFCSNEPIPNEGGDMKTYTEDELTSAVSEAVAPLLAELTALKEERSQDEVEARIAQAKAEAEAQVTEIKNQLDAAELRASEAQKAFEDLVALLTAEEAAREEAARVEQIRESRKAEIKAVAGAFTDEQIEEKLDRWVAMDDDAFAELVESLKLVSSAAATANTGLPASVPAETAMSHTRTNQGTTSSVGDLFDLLKNRVDPRTL